MACTLEQNGCAATRDRPTHDADVHFSDHPFPPKTVFGLEASLPVSLQHRPVKATTQLRTANAGVKGQNLSRMDIAGRAA
jgi:hypothetical protein